MKTVSFVLRLGILVAALLILAYGPFTDALKALCCAVVLAGYLSATDS